MVLIDLTQGSSSVEDDHEVATALRNLRRALDDKTREFARLEEQYSKQALQVGRQEEYISKLERAQQSHAGEISGWIRENSRLHTTVASLREELNVSKHLQKSLEQAQRTAELLSSVLGRELHHHSKPEPVSVKRQRAD